MTRRRSRREREGLVLAASRRRRGIEAPDSAKRFCQLGRLSGNGCGRPIVQSIAGVGICARHQRRLEAIVAGIRP